MKTTSKEANKLFSQYYNIQLIQWTFNRSLLQYENKSGLSCLQNNLPCL